mmetsp:Transcript_46973/g.102194  ORF Transcript_46973/g.102194 Transcript_46973/m.102194 type:complete len:660 (+) Transcript_46973:84-2063(+)
MTEGSPSHSENAALYAFLAAYLLVLLGIGGAAYRRRRQANRVGSKASAYFGGSYSSRLLGLTTFSSIFSGYTIAGIPSEAYEDGFLSLRWLPGGVCMALSMLLFSPRLRRLSVDRCYTSPNDFIKDRFRYTPLTLMCTFLMTAPQIFFCTVQFVSFGSMLSNLTLGAIPEWLCRVIFGVVVLWMERLGGMHSVVLSDAVQGVLMILGFVIVPIFVMGHYGSLGSMASASCSSCEIVRVDGPAMDPLSVPDVCQWPGLEPGQCPSGGMDRINQTLPVGCVLSGCLPHVPGLYAYPDLSSLFQMLFFMVNLLALPLNPHMIQRMYIASDDSALRAVVMELCLAPFLVMMPGIIIGLTKRVYEKQWPMASQMASAFAGVNMELMRKGVVEYGVVSVFTCGALAAIMSTADSVILGVSCTLSYDIYKDILRPGASSGHLVNFSGLVSLALVVVSVCLGFVVDVRHFSTLLTLQNGLLLQAFPAYVSGLWFEISAVAVSLGCFSGLAVFAICFLYNLFAEEPSLTRHVPETIWATLINVIVVFVASRYMEDVYDESTVNRRWGSQLAAEDINDAMADSLEPKYWVIPIALLIAVLSLPWWSHGGGEISSGVFGGFPDWGLIMLGATLVMSILGLAVAAAWRPGEALMDNSSEASSTELESTAAE